MTAPVLTPLESAIFDDDVIAEFEASDDHPVCAAQDAGAVASLVLVCCGASFLACRRHVRLAEMQIILATVLRCRSCGHEYFLPVFEETYRVVPL